MPLRWTVESTRNVLSYSNDAPRWMAESTRNVLSHYPRNDRIPYPRTHSCNRNPRLEAADDTGGDMRPIESCQDIYYPNRRACLSLR